MLRLSRAPKNSGYRVTFALPVDAVRGPVSVVGEFNDWTPGAHLLRKRNNGTVSVAVTVRPGTTLRFRYLAENGNWFDEPEADWIDEQGSVLRIAN